ncbi:MAG: pitrilysin family protein [Candidatus Methanomethylicaceae archaeon]
MPYLKSANIAIWVKVGSKYEPKNMHGASHFIEHLLFTGTKKYPSQDDLLGAVEMYGGQLNAFVEREASCFWVRIPAEYSLQGIEILSDILINPLFEERSVENERKVIIEELKKHMDNPKELVLSMLDELLWPNHPLGRYVGGSIDSIKSIQLSELLQFMQDYYQPDNMVISIVSGNSCPDLITPLSTYFTSLTSRNYRRLPIPFIPYSTKNLVFLERPTLQYHFALGIKALPRTHPDRYALELLNIILGKGMSSRLFNVLRSQRGMLYSIHTYLECLEETGALKIYSGTSGDLVSTIKLFLKEIFTMQKDGVPEYDLEKAKQFYKGRLILGMEDAKNLAFLFGESLLIDGECYSPSQILQKIEQISHEELNRVLISLFQPENFKLAVIGPHLDENTEEILNSLIQGG